MRSRIFMSLPLLLLPTMLVLMVSAISSGDQWLDGAAFDLPLMAGRSLALTHGHWLVLVSLILLFVEILKSVSSSKASMLNQSLSVLNLVLCIGLLFGHDSFANGWFLIITLMTLIDVVAGYVVAVVAARRDLSIERGEHTVGFGG